jgi:hypothetical protein
MAAMRTATALLGATLLACGCASSHVSVSGGSVNASGSVSSGSGGARAIFLIGFLAAANYANAREDPAPMLAPDRVISEQDCSKPVDFTAGNLRCK